MRGAIDQSGWWQTRWFAALAIIASMLPLLWPDIPPLTDLPGHIGRYRILVDPAAMAQHYAVHWALIGNLGVDLLVVALSPLLDVEPATRIIVTLIPAVTVAAMLWVAWEVHGRLPASAAFALPLAYAFPFQFGFVNFCLSAALAIAGLALWIRLSRTRGPVARLLIFMPLSFLLWITHSFGLAMLGLFLFGAETQLRRMRGENWARAALCAGATCLPLAFPFALMLGASGGDRLTGDTGDWFNLTAKAQWVASLLRERWRPWDVAGVMVLAFVCWTAVRSKAMSFAPLLGIPAALGFVAFLLAPRLLQGGSYVDMRLLPYTVALAVLAIRIDPERPELARRMALLGTAFYAARIAVTTIAFAIIAQGQAQVLRALPELPIGSAVLVLVNEPSSKQWSHARYTHISSMAIARRHVFTNDQWALSGQQLIRPLHPSAAPLDRDPSQLVYPPGSEYRPTDLDDAVAGFDRCVFGSVWTIGFPAGRARSPDLRLKWAAGPSAVYAVKANRSQCFTRTPARGYTAR